MRTLLSIALIAAFCARTCLAQTGTVTFYSGSITTKSEATSVLPKNEQPFGGLQGGWVLDGAQRLARVRAGSFVAFHLSPGEHSFTDVGPTGPSKKPLVINVKDGGQYCIRLFAKVIILWVYDKWDNQIEEVPCQRAQREAAHLKPVAIEQVDPAVRAKLDSQTTFAGDIEPQH